MQEIQHRFGELAYAVKEHWATRIHHDLRLKWNGVLLSWAMPAGSSWRVGESRCAVEMEDHNAANILFEGIHPTGSVMVWDFGTWEPHVQSSDILPSLERGFLRFTLRGKKLHGHFTLTRKNAAWQGRRPVWELRKEADLFPESAACEGAAVEWQKSIRTGRTMEEIVRDWNKGKAKPPTLFGEA